MYYFVFSCEFSFSRKISKQDAYFTQVKKYIIFDLQMTLTVGVNSEQSIESAPANFIS